MWVRVQNKMRLLEIKYFSITNTDVEAVFEDHSSTTLGRYSTKEKALKVLDLIEKHLNTQSKIVEKSMSEYIISDMHSLIFQMPQDWEVK